MKIGDRVKLNTNRYGDSPSDPFKSQTIGTVTEIKKYADLNIVVEWEKPYSNVYKECDLLIINISKDKLNAL